MRTPSASEAQIQKGVVDLLRRCCDKRWRYCHIASGGYRMTATTGQLKALGVVAGFPDLVFVGPKKVFFLELKRQGGRLSKMQEEIAAHLKRSGIDFAVASSIEEAISHLKERGILRGVEVL